MMWARPIEIAVVAGFAVACVGDESSSDRILPAPEPLAEAVSANPDVEIGHEDNIDYALTTVGALIISPRNEVVVTQPQEGRLRVFAADGGFRRSIGRRGSGPGEFRTIVGAGILGDTLWVNDQGDRYHFFDLDGQLIGTEQERAEKPGRPYLTIPAHRLADGWKVLPASGFARDLASGALERQPLFIVNPIGSITDSIAYGFPELIQLPGLRSRQPRPGTTGSDTGYVFVPLTMPNQHAFCPDGTCIVVISQRTALSAARDSFQVVRYGPRGDSIDAAWIRYDPVAVPAAFADSIKEVAAASLESRFGAEGKRAAFTALEIPDFFIPVHRVLVSTDGTIWIQIEGVGETRFIVLTPALAARMRVSLPAGVTVVAVDGSNVWGVTLSDLDVPRIVRYRVGQ